MAYQVLDALILQADTSLCQARRWQKIRRWQKFDAVGGFDMVSCHQVNIALWLRHMVRQVTVCRISPPAGLSGLKGTLDQEDIYEHLQ